MEHNCRAKVNTLPVVISEVLILKHLYYLQGDNIATHYKIAMQATRPLRCRLMFIVYTVLKDIIAIALHRDTSTTITIFIWQSIVTKNHHTAYGAVRRFGNWKATKTEMASLEEARRSELTITDNIVEQTGKSFVETHATAHNRQEWRES